jgi:hypothetical protein
VPGCLVPVALAPLPPEPPQITRRLPDQLRVLEDCYVEASLRGNNTAERRITYQLYVYDETSGAMDPYVPFTSAIVTEHLTGDLPISGATLAGQPGGRFVDTQSTLRPGAVQNVSQTFTYTTLFNYVVPPVVDRPVNVYGFGGVWGTLGVHKTQTRIYINGNDGFAEGKPISLCK